jgi:hypothetical protein
VEGKRASTSISSVQCVVPPEIGCRAGSLSPSAGAVIPIGFEIESGGLGVAISGKLW